MKKSIATFTMASLLLLTAFLYAAVPFAALFFDKTAFDIFDSARAAAIDAALGGKRTVSSPAVFDGSERTLVKFADGAKLSDIDKALGDAGIDYTLLASAADRFFLLRISTDDVFLTEHSSLIEYYEPDIIRETMAVSNDPVQMSAYYAAGIHDVWNIASASDDTVVAVLDTGVWREHEDLSGAHILPGYNAVERTAGVYEDSAGHGTAVTGIIAAVADNGIGISGVAHGVTVLPVKVSATRSTIYSSDLISGIRFAADAGADVINMSVGGYSYSHSEQEAINYALAKGCVIIAASGNEGNRDFAGQKCYPASYDGVISVASCSDDGIRSIFSQYNESVDVAAPGESITVPVWENGVSSYKTDSGTSYSAAIVSGIAAIIRSNIPQSRRFGSEEFIAVVADTLGSSRTDGLGHGMINAADAFARAQKPVITGVADSGVYNDKVTLGFNCGNALLDGEVIYDGETVVTDGKHTLVVTEGDDTVTVKFRLSYSPLTATYLEYYNRAVFSFERGTALLDGFPYSSGTMIYTSDRHYFTLTDNGETYTRVVDTGFELPEVYGIEDGGVYTHPVTVKVIGGGKVYIDGIETGNTAVLSDNGAHRLTVQSINGKRTANYRFTINAGSDIKTYTTDLYEPLAAVDEEYGYILLYGDDLVGVRVCGINSPDEIYRIIVTGAIYDHAFYGNNILLFGEAGITVLERSRVYTNQDSVLKVISNDNVERYVYGDGTVYAFGEGFVATVNIESGEMNTVAETDYGCEFAIYYRDTVCVLPYDYAERVYIFDCTTYESSVLYMGRELTSESLNYAGGLITAGNFIYDANSATLIREFDGWHAAAIYNGVIFTDSIMIDITSGEITGVFPDELYKICFGTDINVMLYSGGRIDIASADGIGAAAYGAGPFINGNVTNPETTDMYRSELFYGSKNVIASAAAFNGGLYYIFEGEDRLYSVTDDLLQNASTNLRFIAKSVTVNDNYLTVVFANAPYIYYAPENGPSEGRYIYTGDICSGAVYNDGRIFTVIGGKIVVYNVREGIIEQTDISGSYIAVSQGMIAVLDNRLLRLYDGELRFVASQYAGSGKLVGGDAFAVGGNIYSHEDLSRKYSLKSAVYSLDGGITVTPDGIYSLQSGENIGRNLSAATDHAAVSDGRTLYIIGGGMITVCRSDEGLTLSGKPEITGISDGMFYHDRAVIDYSHGIGYLNGSIVVSGFATDKTGEYEFILPRPAGTAEIIHFTVVPELSRIEFLTASRTVNIGESITLRLRYLPDGSDSLPAVFISDKPGVAIDDSGVLTAYETGNYLITAFVETDSVTLTTECSVTVRDDLIVFPPESGYNVDRNNSYLYGVLPGTKAESILTMFPENAKITVIGDDGNDTADPVSTGDRLILYGDNGIIGDSLTVIIAGDCDRDGYLTAHDLYVLERILKGYKYDDISVAAADVDGNGIRTNGDFYTLRSILTGRVRGVTGTPDNIDYLAEAGVQTYSFVESGEYIDVALYVNKAKLLRALSGKIYYGEGLEFVSFRASDWDCGVYDFGDAIGFYAFTPDGSDIGRAFSPVMNLRFRVTASAGETIRLYSDGLTASFETENGVIPFTESVVLVNHVDNGDLDIEITNAKTFKFDKDKTDYLITIPSDSALADIHIRKPDGCTVSIDGNMIPLSDSGTVIVTCTFANGESRQYNITVHREKTPNLDTNCKLSRLEAEGFRITPNFDPDITEYIITVPQGTEKVNLYCIAQNRNARVVVSDTDLKSDLTVITVTVIAPDGDTMHYWLTVVRDDGSESGEPSGTGSEESGDSTPEDEVPAAVFVSAAALLAAIIAAAVIIIIKRGKNKTDNNG